MSRKGNKNTLVVVEKMTPRKQQTRKKRPNRGKRSASRRIRSPRKKLCTWSPCAYSYLQALVDPFNFALSGKEVCIPDIYDLPSYKLSTRLRGTFEVGSTGCGFIAINPWSFGSDVPIGTVSRGAYGGGVFEYTTATGQVEQVVDGRFPYIGADLRDTRLVAAGIRARYIGTELNKAGAILPIYTTGNLNQLSFQDVLLDPTVTSSTCSRAWSGTFYKPTHPNNFGYTSTSFNYATGDYQLGIMVGGGVGNTSYEWEIVRFYEMIPLAGGSQIKTVPTQTRSESDLPGLGQVKNLLGGLNNSVVGQTAWKLIKAAAASTVTGIAESYVPGASGLLDWGPSIQEL